MAKAEELMERRHFNPHYQISTIPFTIIHTSLIKSLLLLGQQILDPCDLVFHLLRRIIQTCHLLLHLV